VATSSLESRSGPFTFAEPGSMRSRRRLRRRGAGHAGPARLARSCLRPARGRRVRLPGPTHPGQRLVSRARTADATQRRQVPSLIQHARHGGRIKGGYAVAPRCPAGPLDPTTEPSRITSARGPGGKRSGPFVGHTGWSTAVNEGVTRPGRYAGQGLDVGPSG